MISVVTGIGILRSKGFVGGWGFNLPAILVLALVHAIQMFVFFL